MKIHEIYKIFAEIDEELEENGGELTDALQERLAINMNDFEKKVNNICYLIDHANGANAVLKKQIDKLKKAVERNEKTVELLRGLIQSGVKKYGKLNKSGNRHVKTGEYSITVVPYEALEIIDQLEIPKHYMYGSPVAAIQKEICELIIVAQPSVSFNYTPDKKAITDDLKTGVVVKGAALITKEKLMLK